MISSLKAVEIYIGKTVARNMYNRMIKFRVGTNEVISTARRVIGKNDNVKNEEREIVRILKIRRENVEKEIKKCKYEMYKKRKTVVPYLSNERAKIKYREAEYMHKQFTWKIKVAASKKKVQFAREKKNTKKNQRSTENRLNGNTDTNNKFYLVTDEKLTRNRPQHKT